MIFSSLSDMTVAGVLGRRLEQLRLEQDLTQQQLADEIGISRLSYRKLEGGEGKLVNFIAALRILGRVNALQQVLPEETFSPMQQLKLKGRVRKRASGTKSSVEATEKAASENNELDW